MQHEKFTTASERVLAQLAGEYLWAVGTNENSSIASSRSATYRAAERNFITVVRTVYGLGTRRAQRVRNLLSVYGPDDRLQGTVGRGIYSYVAWVMANRPGKYDA